MATPKKMRAHFNSQIRKFPDLLRLYFVAMCASILRCQRLSTDGKLKYCATHTIVDFILKIRCTNSGERLTDNQKHPHFA